MSARQSSRRTSVIPREGRAPHPGPPDPQPRRRGGPRGLPKRARRRRRMTLTHPSNSPGSAGSQLLLRGLHSGAHDRAGSSGRSAPARPRRTVRPATTYGLERDETAPDPVGLSAIPVSAGALVFDRAGRLLILKPTYKSGWTIPGGVLETDGWRRPGTLAGVRMAGGTRPPHRRGPPGAPGCMDFRRPARASPPTTAKIAAPAPSRLLYEGNLREQNDQQEETRSPVFSNHPSASHMTGDRPSRPQ